MSGVMGRRQRRTALPQLLLCALLQATASALQNQPGRQGLSSGRPESPTLLGGSAPINATVTVDLGSRRPVSPTLWGVFFEEIGHAGDGGLFADLVQDSSFDALAFATGFLQDSGATRLDLAPAQLAALAQARQNRAAAPPPQPASTPGGGSLHDHARAASRARSAAGDDGRNDVIIAWSALDGTAMALTRALPLNEGNTVAMEVTGSAAGPAGILNSGYWGIPLEAGASYTLSLYLRAPQGPAAPRVTVCLVSADMATFYANATLGAVTQGWEKHSAELVAASSTTDAQLAILVEGEGRVAVDAVTLFPTANVRWGKARGHMNPWPFRQDLLGALVDLKPRFLRFPGGCYVEGDWLRNAFRWKNSVGPVETRPGHFNGVWGYWSSEGLGLFEYMLLADELGAEPIWVLNNGIAHQDSVPGADIMHPWVQDALDSIEFISGAADTKWGALRAAMGRPEPWAISYVAIGNEGCGLPWDPPSYKFMYLQNYLAFWGALHAAYPHLRLIASCDMGQDAPTDLWEYHVYTNPQEMFARRHAFNGMSPATSHHVFASEFAVTDGGGGGNLIGAVAEAAFMTGVERNSEVVEAGSYAPLFVNVNSKPWPTNMIVFDNHKHYVIPSYHVQSLFATYLGTHYASTSIEMAAQQDEDENIAASTTCQNPECSSLAVKIVNFCPGRQLVRLALLGGTVTDPDARLIVLTSPSPVDENSFDMPDKIQPEVTRVLNATQEIILPLEPYSVNVLTLRTKPSDAQPMQAS